MRNIRKYITISIFLALFLFSSFNLLFAEVRAFVDRNQVAIGESINLTIVLEDENSSIEMSNLKSHFKVIEQGRTSSVKIINNKYSKEVFFSYILIPKQIGKFTIPPIKVKDKFTNKITIVVTKNKTKVTGNNEVFVDSSISNDSPFLNEQIVYSFKIYNRVEISDLNFQLPNFENFIAKPIKPDKFYRTQIEGMLFNVTEIKYVLIPIKSGKVNIQGGVLSFGVVMQGNNTNSFFNDPFFLGGVRLKKHVLQAKDLNINIKELPKLNYENFSNIVGRIGLNVTIDKKRIKQEESATLSVEIEGVGNLMDCDSVDVKLSDSFKIYKDKPEEEINLTEAGFSGKKTFRFAIVPLKKGSYEIEPIKLSFFDIVEKKYKLLESLPIKIVVEKGDKSVSKGNDNGTTISAPLVKKKVKYLKKDILPIKKELAIENESPLLLKEFIFALLVPIMLFLILKVYFLIFRRKLNDKQLMQQKALLSLKDAKKFNDAFLTNLYNYVIYSILATSNQRGENLSYEEVAKILLTKKDENVVKRVIDFLKRIDEAKYSGVSLEKNYKALIKEAKDITKNL